MKITRGIAFSVLLLALPAGFLIAEEPDSPLVSELRAFLVVDGELGEELTEADEIKPGQKLEYQITYRNVSDEPLNQLHAVGIIPGETSLLNESWSTPSGVDVLFSADDGESFHRPPFMIIVTDQEGNPVEREATVEDYDQIRWGVPVLQPGADLIVKYRVQVQ